MGRFFIGFLFSAVVIGSIARATELKGATNDQLLAEVENRLNQIAPAGPTAQVYLTCVPPGNFFIENMTTDGVSTVQSFWLSNTCNDQMKMFNATEFPVYRSKLIAICVEKKMIRVLLSPDGRLNHQQAVYETPADCLQRAQRINRLNPVP